MDGYVFAGNRAFVLDEMLSLGIEIKKIWAVPNSYLEKYLSEKGMAYSVITDRASFFENIETEHFDYFISNGLPIILPISRLATTGKRFINIHPSLLPDLRGADPVHGAILYQRDAGATCHEMDDGIDTGAIISQVRISLTADLDAGLLYQLSFQAEREAFRLAYDKEFTVAKAQANADELIYYTFKASDLDIDLENESPNQVIARVNAFSTGNKGARLHIDDDTYVVESAEIIENPYATDFLKDKVSCDSTFRYENRIIAECGGKYIKFLIREVI